jgi:hypothetical protein
MTRHIPENGCSTSIYPDIEWKQVPCGKLPERLKNTDLRRPPVALSKGEPFAGQVGSGIDIVASVAQGRISGVDASFAFVKTTGVTNVSGDGKTVSRRDQFSLQINSNKFLHPLCGNEDTLCGWQQFILSNDPGNPPGYLWTQHWLLGRGASCPLGWDAHGDDCALDSDGASPPVVTNVSLNLRYLWMTADVIGTQDVVTLGYTSGATVATAVSSDSVLGLASRWTQSEFNIVGDLTLHNARFDPNTTIAINQDVTIVDAAATDPLTFGNNGTTGETNNLNLLTPVCISGQRLTFEESNAPNATFSCSAPPPLNLCAAATKAVAEDQKTLQTLQNRFKEPICSGPASYECAQAVRAASAKLQTDVKLERADCK